jgi:hypothetical protein
MNSAAVIAQARRIYFLFLERCSISQDPLGIVISHPDSGQGRVVFELPVLLPDEHFIPLDLLRGRTNRNRSPRTPYRG